MPSSYSLIADAAARNRSARTTGAANPGALGMMFESARRYTFDPLVLALGDRLGLLPDGSWARRKEEYEATKEAYVNSPLTATDLLTSGGMVTGLALAQRLGLIDKDSNLPKKAAAFGWETGPAMIPFAGGAGAAAKAAGLAGRLGLNVSRATAAVALTGAEGALFGLGESTGEDLGTQALYTGLGGGMGSLGAIPIMKSKLAPKLFAEVDKNFPSAGRILTKWFKPGGAMGTPAVNSAAEHLGKYNHHRNVVVARNVQNTVAATETWIDSQQKAFLKSGGNPKYAPAEGKLRERVEKKIYQAMSPLHPEVTIDDLPRLIQPYARVMRDDIDELGRLYRQSEYVSEKVAKAIEKGEGVYGNIAHEVFDNPKYLDFIKNHPDGQARWRQMATFLQENTKLSDTQIEAKMLHMLDDPYNAMNVLRGDPTGKNSRGPLGKMNRKIEQERLDLAPEVRAFLGEYQDPFINYQRTVSNLVANIEFGKLLSEISDDLVTSKKAIWAKNGDGEFLYPMPDDWVPRSGENKGQKLWLRDRDQFEALVLAQNDQGRNLFTTINGITKFMKTVASPQTHARNFLSGHMMMVLQGHANFLGERGVFDPVWRANKAKLTKKQNVLGEAFDPNLTPEEIKKLPKKQRRHREAADAYQYLLKDGTVGEGTLAGDLDLYRRQAQSIVKQGGNAIEWVGDLAAANYRAEDDFWKVSLFLKEKKRFLKLTDLSDEKAARMAADVVRDGMQIYSRVPLAVQKIRSFPFTGPFVSFPAEVTRNVLNTVARSVKEIRNEAGIKGLKRIGWQRLIGTAASLGGTGYGLQKAGQLAFDITDEQLGALRSSLPPWTQNSQIMPLPSNAEKGEYHYVDLSFVDPYNYLKKPVIAILKNVARDDFSGAEKMLNVLKETVDPAAAPEIFWSELVGMGEELARNKQTPYSTKMKKAAYRAYRAFAPGAVLTGERMMRSLDAPGVREALPSASKYGKEFKFFDEAAALFGPRISTVSVPRAFRYKAREYASARFQASTLYKSESHRGLASQSAYRSLQKRREAEETNRQAGQHLLRYIEDAKALGLSNREIARQLSAGNIAKMDIEVLLAGRVPLMRFK